MRTSSFCELYVYTNLYWYWYIYILTFYPEIIYSTVLFLAPRNWISELASISCGWWEPLCTVHDHCFPSILIILIVTILQLDQYLICLKSTKLMTWANKLWSETTNYQTKVLFLGVPYLLLFIHSQHSNPHINTNKQGFKSTKQDRKKQNKTERVKNRNLKNKCMNE